MNDARYQELTGRLLDEEASLEELDELSRNLRQQPDRLADLQFHLVAWELFSQQCRPERSAEAFAAAWQTRLAAESGSASFVKRTRDAATTDQSLARKAGQPSKELAATRWESLRRIFTVFQRLQQSGGGSTAHSVGRTGHTSHQRRQGRRPGVSRPGVAPWRWGITLPIGACLATLLVLVLPLTWWLRPTIGQPVLVEINGAGLILERAGQSVPALPGTGLLRGDALRAPATVTAALGFGPEHTRIIFGPDTGLRVLSLSRGKRFDLEHGKIEASVARQRPLQPMILRTPQAEARVLGTHFTLTVTTNATRLEVAQGKVSITRLSDGRAQKVVAGRYALVAAGAELSALPVTGRILAEYWTNFAGEFQATMTATPGMSDHPDGFEYLTRFEVQSRKGPRFGYRICGYLHPPRTGEYTFSVAGGAEATVYLSPDEKPENRVQIHYSWSRHADLVKPQPGDRGSVAIPLVAGRRYYVEVLYESDHRDIPLTLTWQGPEQKSEIIEGEFLSPFEPKEKKQ